MKPRLTILFPLVAALCWPVLCQASSANRISFEQLAKTADRVVVARMQSARSEWGPEHKRIFTEFRFQVDQDLDGGDTTDLTVRQPGGTVGRLGQIVHGYPKFIQDETVLLFLRRSGSRFRVMGLTQGVFRIHSEGTRQLLVQLLDGLSFPDQPTARPFILERQEGFERIRALRKAEDRP